MSKVNKDDWKNGANTKKLIQTHQGLVDAYGMFWSNIVGKVSWKYDEEVKNKIVKMCKHIVEDFGDDI